MKYPIYLDNNATTPIDPKVLDSMLPYFRENFGNAASKSHLYGWVAEKAVDQGREQVAQIIEASPEEILFTSGATESNNLALFGVAHHYKKFGNHLITVQTEHKSVLDSCEALEKQGFVVTYLPVNKHGFISLEALSQAIRPETLLVSIMAGNNETGSLQPIEKVGEICQAQKVLFHCDGTQAIGKISLNVKNMKIDLLSFSAHKIYGPKGIGALFCSKKKPRVRLEPLIYGGGHEQKMRSGTLNVPGIVGFGQACTIAFQNLSTEAKLLAQMREQLFNGICSKLTGISLNGHKSQSLPGTLNLSFSGVDGNALLSNFKGVAVSSGSACTSASLEASYVLKAMGVPKELALASIRFSIGRFNTKEEIDIVIQEVHKVVAKLREQFYSQ